MKNQIKALLVDRLKLERDAASIGDDEPLFGPEGLGLDSIDALELVLGIEQEFGVVHEAEERTELDASVVSRRLSNRCVGALLKKGSELRPMRIGVPMDRQGLDRVGTGLLARHAVG